LPQLRLGNLRLVLRHLQEQPGDAEPGGVRDRYDDHAQDANRYAPGPRLTAGRGTDHHKYDSANSQDDEQGADRETWHEAYLRRVNLRFVWYLLSHEINGGYGCAHVRVWEILYGRLPSDFLRPRQIRKAADGLCSC